MTRQRTGGRRRPMAIAIGIAAAAVLAAGCGSSGGSSSGGGGATSNAATQNGGGAVAGATVPTANLPVLQTVGTGEGQLNLIAWEGYLDPKWVKPFEQQTGCQVNAKYASSSDEMVALMKNGGGGQYDMVSSSGDADLRILYAGDAHPVNVNLIPSLEGLLPRLPVAGLQHDQRRALRRLAAVGPERADVQHQGLPDGADVVERHLRPEVQGPGDGAGQPDPDRRRGAVPEDAPSRRWASPTRTS